MTLDPRDRTLWACIEHDDVERLELLLAWGAAPVYHYDSGWSPLHHAVDAVSDGHRQSGSPLHLRVIAVLIRAGADVNALHSWSGPGSPETPLDVAVRYENEMAADALRRAGARPGAAFR